MSKAGSHHDHTEQTFTREDIPREFRDVVFGAATLKKISLFGGFHEEELRQLYGLGSIHKVRAHTHLVIEGQKSSGLSVLLQGKVSIYKSDPATGHMQRLAYLEKGEHFGELSLVDSAARSATVAAETSCLAFELPAEKFHAFLKERGGDLQLRFYRACAQELVGRLRKQNADYIASQQLLWKHALGHPPSQEPDR